MVCSTVKKQSRCFRAKEKEAKNKSLQNVYFFRLWYFSLASSRATETLNQKFSLGGHTAEMLQLVKSLDGIKYTPRSYIVANTDILSEEKATMYEQALDKVIQK
jgi:hypothetical protein